MQEVFIRTDASKEIGLGHLIRCMSLAYMLKAEWKITFYCRQIPEQYIREIEIKGFNLKVISEESSFFEDIVESCIVILDGYKFDSYYQFKIKSFNCPLVCIDDLCAGKFNADLIINHAPNVNPEDYHANTHTMFALGLGFVMLRPIFLEELRKVRLISQVKNVLICIGGADPENITHVALEVVCGVNQVERIYVVTGPAYRFGEKLEKLAKSDVRIEYRSCLDAEEMLKYMLKSDLAIVPSSGILYEVLAAGTFAAIGIFAENQKYFYESFKGKPNIFDAGDFSRDKIKRALLEAMSKSFKPVEKLLNTTETPNIRFNKIFKLLSECARLKIRKVERDDLNITFKWASNDRVRRNSFSKGQIDIHAHNSWFFNKINDSHCRFFIGEVDSCPVGTIRFDRISDIVKISYLVDPDYQGKGYGTLLLLNGIKKLVSDSSFKDYKKITGDVVKTNLLSIKAFKRLGFVPRDENDYIVFEKKIL